MSLHVFLESDALNTVSPPVTLADVKAQLRIDHEEFDSLISDHFIPAGIDWIEGETKRALVSRSHRWGIRKFPSSVSNELVLPLGKASGVASIAYISSQATITLTGPTSGSPEGVDYREDLRSSSGAVLRPPVGSSWPSVDEDAVAPIVVTFTAGYAAGEVPSELIQALMWYVQDAIDQTCSEPRYALVSAWRLRGW